jgi:dihydroorotase
VLPSVWRARERGVLFDVGHGAGSFSYRVARAALGQGFPPDTVSSDLHVYNTAGPVFDQATTLSKLLHLGMPLADVIRATTTVPAAAIGWDGKIGALAAGREADVSLFEVRDGRWALPDTMGQTEVVDRLLVPRVVIRAGQVTELAPGEHVAGLPGR